MAQNNLTDREIESLRNLQEDMLKWWESSESHHFGMTISVDDGSFEKDFVSGMVNGLEKMILDVKLEPKKTFWDYVDLSSSLV